MKRILSLLMIAAMLFCFCACDDSQTVQSGMVGNGAQDETSPYGVMQNKVIGSFGITVENSRIVAVKSHYEGYIEYVVVRYNEKGEKTGELSYYFCLNEQIFESMTEENKDNTAVQVYEDKRYLTIPTNYANNGVYAKDLEIMKKDFHIKGQMTPEDYKN